MSLATLEPEAPLRAHVVPASRPSTSLLISDRNVVAMRRRAVVRLGSLATRAVLDGASDRRPLVGATDADGMAWWIPADAVWSDVNEETVPQRPRPIGMATGDSAAGTTIAGLSDRLGWEACEWRRRGATLQPVAGAIRRSGGLPDAAEILDGRLGHDVPTVVVVRDDVVRWGAGETWTAAIQRAMYGASSPVSTTDAESELIRLDEVLGHVGLGVASVDLGSERLRSAGINRCSVQLFRRTHVEGRSWDA